MRLAAAAFVAIFVATSAAAQQGPAPPAPLQDRPTPRTELPNYDPAKAVVLIFSRWRCEAA